MEMQQEEHVPGYVTRIEEILLKLTTELIEREGL